MKQKADELLKLFNRKYICCSIQQQENVRFLILIISINKRTHNKQVYHYDNQPYDGMFPLFKIDWKYLTELEEKQMRAC